jgi:hypothetical protein
MTEKHNDIQHNHGYALGRHAECPFADNVVLSVIMLSHYTKIGCGE